MNYTKSVKNEYVIECAGLFIKEGGFTKKIAEAKKYNSIKEAKLDLVRPWLIKNIINFKCESSNELFVHEIMNYFNLGILIFTFVSFSNGKWVIEGSCTTETFYKLEKL